MKAQMMATGSLKWSRCGQRYFVWHVTRARIPNGSRTESSAMSSTSDGVDRLDESKSQGPSMTLAIGCARKESHL